MYDDFFFFAGDFDYVSDYARTTAGSSASGTACEIFITIYQPQILVLFLLRMSDVAEWVYSKTDRGTEKGRDEEIIGTVDYPFQRAAYNFLF